MGGIWIHTETFCKESLHWPQKLENGDQKDLSRRILKCLGIFSFAFCLWEVNFHTSVALRKLASRKKERWSLLLVFLCKLRGGCLHHHVLVHTGFNSDGVLPRICPDTSTEAGWNVANGMSAAHGELMHWFMCLLSAYLASNIKSKILDNFQD